MTIKITNKQSAFSSRTTQLQRHT